MVRYVIVALRLRELIREPQLMLINFNNSYSRRKSLQDLPSGHLMNRIWRPTEEAKDPSCFFLKNKKISIMKMIKIAVMKLVGIVAISIKRLWQLDIISFHTIQTKQKKASDLTQAVAVTNLIN